MHIVGSCDFCQKEFRHEGLLMADRGEAKKGVLERPFGYARAAIWQRIGQYEYEYNAQGYTGWYRCVGGRLANGHWPEWNNRTGETR